MANVILKTTLLRANPGVIRQFVIDDKRTLEDLLKTAAVIHGWKPGSKMQLNRGSTTLGIKSRICDKIKKNQEYIIRVPMAGNNGNRGFQTGQKDLFWEFFLEVVSVETASPDQPEPALLRSYGLHPPEKCRTMREFNEIHKKLSKGSAYYSYYMNQIVPGDYQVNQNGINSRLKRIITLGLGEFYVNHSYGYNLWDSLQTNTVAQLKRLIYMMDIPISQNQRKSDLIDDMVDYFDRPEFWQSLLKEMPYTEYLQWKEFVTSKKSPDPSQFYYFPTLIRCEFCRGNYGTNIAFPEPFLNYYEEFMISTGDKELIFHKKARDVLRVCMQLYGIFPKSIYTKLCSIMYPDEKQLSDSWQKWSVDSIFGYFPWEKMGSDVVYDGSMVKEEKAVSIRNSERFRNNIFYIPDPGQIEQIQKYGLSYSENSRNVLIKHIKSAFGKVLSEVYFGRVCNLMYDYFHFEISDSFYNYISCFCDFYVSRPEMNRLEKEARKLIDEVRLISLGGYTRKEIQQFSKQKK